MAQYKEHQNTEWKESWQNEYFKWIAGFANAQGGTLFIGIDENGNTKHLDNVKKLLEDLPNQVRDLLGLMVDVNLHTKNGNDYLEIIVEAYDFPISLSGKYYYRSGSTLQELKGAALSKFLLQRHGKKWDAVPIPNAMVTDLKTESFDFFRRKANNSKRLTKEDLDVNNQELLENLQLYLEDEAMLKRAAILLFHPKPEKYVTGAYIKIGYFENEADLIFQDEVHGNIFEQIEQTITLLFSKYIKAIISYDGISRIESYEYPKEAIREGLLNAIAHKDYSGGSAIQIKVYSHKLMIWNSAQLPDHWTIDNLLKTHPSKPYNPDISNTLFRSGYIESWGRGIEKMMNYCQESKIPLPTYLFEASGFLVEFKKDIYHETYLSTLGLNDRQIKAILFTKEKGRITNSNYQQINNISKRTATNELSELVKQFSILIKHGTSGSNIFYTLGGAIVGQVGQ